MSAQEPYDDADGAFSALIGNIKAIQSDHIELKKPKPRPYPHQTLKDQARVLEELAHGEFDDHDLQPGDSLQFVRTGLQKQVLRKLRKGQFSVGAELDLHGLRREAATETLKSFIAEVQSRGIRCVRIIHGKGYGSSNQGPVIKPLVNRWLRKQDQILAFCSARPVDGGTGAVYVLLKLR